MNGPYSNYLFPLFNFVCLSLFIVLFAVGYWANEVLHLDCCPSEQLVPEWKGYRCAVQGFKLCRIYRCTVQVIHERLKVHFTGCYLLHDHRSLSMTSLFLFTESVPVHHYCPSHRYGGQSKLWALQHSYSSHIYHWHQRQPTRTDSQDGKYHLHP